MPQSAATTALPTTRTDDATAMELQRALRTAGNKTLADRLVTLIGTNNPAEQISANHQAAAWLNLTGHEGKTWTASAHPRAAAGATSGGQFVTAGTTSTTTTKAAHAGAQAKLGATLTPEHIRNYQRQHGLLVDGKIGRQTAAMLLGQANAKDVPPGAMTAQQRQALEHLSRQAPAIPHPTAGHPASHKKPSSTKPSSTKPSSTTSTATTPTPHRGP